MEKNESFKQEFEQNKAFYQKAKNWIRKNHCGRYVIIGAGQLLDVQDTYDLALERANELKRKLLHVMVFKAEEEPFFGTIKFGMRSTYAHPGSNSEQSIPEEVIRGYLTRQATND